MAASRLDGQAAIVTGAGVGLGRAHALRLASLGCAVVVNDIAGNTARSVVDEIEAAGGRAVADAGSVADEVAGRGMVDRAIDSFGRLDILVCNAGVAGWQDVAEMPLDELRRVLDVNLWGTLHPVHAAWPHMLAARYGRIVLTASQAGLWGQQKSVHYCASKAAMIGIARALALDVPDGCDIRANVIAPAAYTPMSAVSIDPRWAGFMSPDHVAKLVAWLASTACRESGMILNAGAGRVRRVRVVGSEVQLFDTAHPGRAFAALAGDREPIGSFDAGRRLMPEIFEDVVEP